MEAKDLVSGLITPLMIVATVLGYSVLVFSGPLAPYIPLGAGFGLIGAGVTAIVFALGSGLNFSIAGPDSKAVAVMASVAALILENLTRDGRPEAIAPTILAALIVGTLIVGASSYFFGAMKLGRWIRFMPYPVIGGFMAASGWFLVTGAIRVLAREPLSLSLIADVASGKSVAQICVAVVIAALLNFSHRLRRPMAFPVVLIGAAAAIIIALRLAGIAPVTARESGWLLQVPPTAVSIPVPWLFDHARHIDIWQLPAMAAQYVALVTVIIATLLLSIMAIEVETRTDVDLDHELKLNGIANLLAGLTGGGVGTLSVSRTLFSHRIGARGRGAGVLVGLICLLPLTLGPEALGFAPLPVLAALLLELGGAMLYEWVIRGWRTMQRADYFQLLTIFLTIVRFDFVAGVGVGVIAACITFAINTSRIRLVKHEMDRSNFASRVDRPIYDADTLVRLGGGIQILWLNGFIFFGTAHHLLSHIKSSINKGDLACRCLILEFRHVLGIDSSAVVTLFKLRHLAEKESFRLIFSGLSPHLDHALRLGGLIEPNDALCRVFPDLDAALEWSEELLLDQVASRERAKRSTRDWLETELGGSHFEAQLWDYLTQIEKNPGESVFRQGDVGDSLFLLSSGRVTILFQPQGGKEIRLRTMLGHTLLGEMGVYRNMPRGASVLADEPTVVFQLARSSLARMERENPALAHAFHKFVIRTLASRLDFANREVAALQR